MRLLLCSLLLASTAPALAAPRDRTLEEQLAAVSAAIRATPEHAELYVRRADLYRRARKWDLALADARRAAERDPARADVHLVRGRVLADTGRLAEARAELGQFVVRRPDDERGRSARADVLARLGLVRAAVRDFDHLLATSRAPTPEAYLARVELLRDSRPAWRREALKGLASGLERLGPVVSLELPALQLELELGLHAAALTRVGRLSRDIPRMDGWHVRRAEVLLAAGREDDARVAYRAAAESLARLPASRRTTAAARELADEIARALAALTARR